MSRTLYSRVNYIDSEYIEMHKLIDKKEIGIDEIIKKYKRFINGLEAARDWSNKKENADGVDPILVLLIARNYGEIAYYDARNGKVDDSVAHNIKAILEYSRFYRMCRREKRNDFIGAYNPLYWIASTYRNMGDVQYRAGKLTYRLGSFVTADSFFTKHSEHFNDIKNSNYSEYDYNKRLEEYSRYYSAMSSHNVFIIVSADATANGNKLPKELKYYLNDAFINYKNLYESPIYLSKDEQKYIDLAIDQIINACLQYLDDNPEEEGGDIMLNREEYIKPKKKR